MSKSENSTLELMMAEILEKQDAIEKNMPGRQELATAMRTLLEEQMNVSAKDLIPLSEHQRQVDDMLERNACLQKEVAVLGSELDRLKHQIKEHASCQPVKRFFRWLFNRHHLAAIIIITFYNMLFVVMICVLNRKDQRIANMRDDSLKYSFIRAKGLIPNACATIDDWFIEGNQEKIQQVRQTVLDYEKKIRHASDSIAHKERLKMISTKMR